MLEFLNKIVEWLEQYYKLITGIVVPILVAIISLFKVKHLIKKEIPIKGDNNNAIIAEGSVNNANNISNQNIGNGVINIGSNNQIHSYNHLGIEELQQEAKAFIQSMYPKTQKACEKLRLNSLEFLGILEQQFSYLSQEEIDKFSEADVQMILQNAIKSAARRDSKEIHSILAKLIADRVQKPKHSIVELAINESIEVTAKLDANLIKILALSFIFTKTKYTSLQNEERLIEELTFLSTKFKDLDVSISQFEHLESISCGKVVPLISNKLVVIISQNYPHLFLKEVSEQQLIGLALPEIIKSACFLKKNDKYQINPMFGLYLFEDVKIPLNGSSFIISDDSLKKRLKAFVKGNRLSNDEIKELLLNLIPNFNNIINLWDQKGFSKFSLTSVGIVIGRAYLEQEKFGVFDINMWIN